MNAKHGGHFPMIGTIAYLFQILIRNVKIRSRDAIIPTEGLVTTFAHPCKLNDITVTLKIWCPSKLHHSALRASMMEQ